MFTVYFLHLSPLSGDSILHFIDGKIELGEGEVHRTVHRDGH